MLDALRDGCVHVWCGSLEATDAQLASLRSLLTDAELKRGDRIRIERPRRQFFVARAMLRQLLERYTGQPASKVQLVVGGHGKPSLDSTPLSFNLSHSHEKVLFAFTANADIGVDIERVRENIRCEDLAARYFAPGEVDALMAMPSDQRYRGFFTCWTRKEAIIKAKGTGLSMPLNQFEVAFAPQQPPALLRTDWDTTEAAQWQLSNLDMDDDYVAALAVRGEIAHIESFMVHLKTFDG